MSQRNTTAANSPPINTEHCPVVREYDIGGTKYIVKATVKAGASEDAAAKVRRLLRRELDENAGTAAEIFTSN